MSPPACRRLPGSLFGCAFWVIDRPHVRVPFCDWPNPSVVADPGDALSSLADDRVGPITRAQVILCDISTAELRSFREVSHLNPLGRRKHIFAVILPVIG